MRKGYRPGKVCGYLGPPSWGVVGRVGGGWSHLSGVGMGSEQMCVFMPHIIPAPFMDIKIYVCQQV